MSSWKNEAKENGEKVRRKLADKLSHQETVTLWPFEIGNLIDYIQILKNEAGSTTAI